MCGICGIFHLDGKRVDTHACESMRDRLFSRGPDDAGLWQDESVVFGHRRLSIIDLSPLGHQPMVDEETGNAICYNGEIYNYQQIAEQLQSEGIKFQGHSDTEVVLKAYRKWGIKCVERFIGMFAFAIWDKKQKTLYIFRDRVGIKPLFYAFQNQTLLFASRLKSLLAHPQCPKEISPESLALYLEVGYVPAPRSILSDISKLEPGHYLRVDKGGIQKHCYWSIEDIAIDHSLESVDEIEMTERLDALLRHTVNCRLISDVPLGAFLSGGIDSSTVVAIMADLSPSRVKTYTIGFEEDGASEAPYARKIAAHLNTEHHEKTIRPSDLLALLDTYTEHYDEPFADSSGLPMTLVSQFAREDVTVALSGDGGDELFAGYHYYDILARLRRLYGAPRFLRQSLASLLSVVPTHKVKLLASAMRQESLNDSFAFMKTCIKDFDRSALLNDHNLTHIKTVFENRLSGFQPLDPVSQACRLDLCYYMPDDLLQKVDVASMSCSLEARVPILDHRIVEFSQKLPLKWKRRNGHSKYLLRRVLSKYLPRDMFDRPKAGFLVPIDQWFRHELRSMLEEHLSPEMIQQTGFLKPQGVRQLIDLHLSGQRETHPILWNLLTYVRWYLAFQRWSA